MDLFCRIISLVNAAKFSFFCRNLSEALSNRMSLQLPIDFYRYIHLGGERGVTLELNTYPEVELRSFDPGSPSH